jgi:hypothetical protein
MKMDWLRLEERIRVVLRAYIKGTLECKEALNQIDDALGEETGRGFELDWPPNS